MRKTDQLRFQHDSIVEVVIELTGYLDRSLLSDNLPKVVSLLVRLSGRVKAHLAMEDSKLYPDMVSSADPQAAELASAYKSEMGGLSEAFLQYMKKWLSASNISADPDGFVAETQALFAALGDRIERENTILYPVADRL